MDVVKTIIWSDLPEHRQEDILRASGINSISVFLSQYDARIRFLKMKGYVVIEFYNLEQYMEFHLKWM